MAMPVWLLGPNKRKEKEKCQPEVSVHRSGNASVASRAKQMEREREMSAWSLVPSQWQFQCGFRARNEKRKET
jgi:hypothetical protein